METNDAQARMLEAIYDVLCDKCKERVKERIRICGLIFDFLKLAEEEKEKLSKTLQEGEKC